MVAGTDIKKSKVKSVRVYHSKPSAWKTNDHSDTCTLYKEYDGDGNKIKEVTYEDGSPEQETELVFENNKLIKQIHHFVAEDVTETLYMVYDDKGRISHVEKEYMDGTKDTKTIQYNENGDPLLKTAVDSYGDIEEVEEYVYEGKNLVKYLKKNGSGTVITESAFEFEGDKLKHEKRTDEHGKQYEVFYDFSHGGEVPDMLVKNHLGKTIEAHKHIFDENKRLKEEISESSRDGYRKTRIVYEYDSMNNVTAIHHYDQNQRLFRKQLNVYDDRNLLIEEIYHEERPEVGVYLNQSMFYEYETFDN